MFLSGETTVVGLFGDPVTHSLSPQMHNTALKASGINSIYVPFHVTAAQLSDAVKGIRAMEFLGINLTIPHKVSVCAFLDKLDHQAVLIGAVNTIVNYSGQLMGFNTDGKGLLSALDQIVNYPLPGANVLLLGAGGASRAAAVALSEAGVSSISIANRNLSKAQGLADEISRFFKGTSFASYSLDSSLAVQLAEPVDLLVNASAVGLHGDSFDFDILNCVRAKGTVYDMVYGAKPTPLVSSAKALELRAADGLAMLAGQGEESFRLWFGQEPPKGIMLKALMKAVGRSH